MSRLLGPIARFFVAPADRVAPARTAIPPAARVVVLGASDEVAAVAAATALGLRASGSPAGLVALWRGDRAPRSGVATPAASRLAATLAARDLPAAACGRLAWLTLPDDPEAAATAVRQASALVAGPFVTGLAGPWPSELETLIAEHDIAIVSAPPDTPLARAALAALADRGIPALATAPLRRGAARTLALAGLAANRLAVPDEVAEAGPGAVAAELPVPETATTVPSPPRRTESIWTDS